MLTLHGATKAECFVTRALKSQNTLFWCPTGLMEVPRDAERRGDRCKRMSDNNSHGS